MERKKSEKQCERQREIMGDGEMQTEEIDAKGKDALEPTNKE